jgi:DNA replication and repair protein RecF
VRNLQPLQLQPRARFNVFAGDNGQGKTNLLEAIFVVAALRSFRTSRLADVIGFGAERARLGARVRKDDMVHPVIPAGRRLSPALIRPASRLAGSGRDTAPRR